MPCGSVNWVTCLRCRLVVDWLSCFWLPLITVLRHVVVVLRTVLVLRVKKPAVGRSRKKKFKIGFGGVSETCLRNLLKKSNAPDQYAVIEPRRITTVPPVVPDTDGRTILDVGGERTKWTNSHKSNRTTNLFVLSYTRLYLIQPHEFFTKFHSTTASLLITRAIHMVNLFFI